jgi:Na+-driven multidrug efflux pump
MFAPCEQVVLPAGSPAIAIATPYLMIRGLTMIPSMIVTVGFSTFRGLVDTVTPLQVLPVVKHSAAFCSSCGVSH